MSVSRGAAAAMTLTFSTLLLTMSRNTLTFLRETQAMNWIPFDSAIAFHKYVAVLALFFTGNNRLSTKYFHAFPCVKVNIFNIWYLSCYSLPQGAQPQKHILLKYNSRRLSTEKIIWF